MKLGYFVSETVTNLRRNLLMTIAAISTVAISLLLLGGVQILGMAVDNVTLNWEAKVEVSAYLRDDIQPSERDALIAEISDMPQVQNVTYVSEQQAFEEFKEIYRDQPEFWQALSPGDLPASLRIKLHDAGDAEEVAAAIEGAPGVDEVEDGGELIRRLLRVNALLRTITFAMSVILLIAAAALIANTIRLAIYARREEIGIMKLVGATNWFIRIPFMLEGVVAALVGAFIASVIVIAAEGLVFSRMGEAVPFLGPVFSFSTGEIAGVVGLLTAVGVGVGLVGSSLALRRFLEA